MIWLGWVLWYINHGWLFNAKTCFYKYIQYIFLVWFDLVLWYINIICYLLANPVYLYI